MRNIRQNISLRTITEVALVTVLTAAVIGFALLVFYRVRPIQTIKIQVPVATTKSSYYPGEEISGIFFGRVYWSGKVVIERQIFCDRYVRFIKDYRDGTSNVFNGSSTPHTLNGVKSLIGNLPGDAPVGEQCVVEFNNSYVYSTPFGDREINVSYYTLGFNIVAKPSDAPVNATADISGASTQASGSMAVDTSTVATNVVVTPVAATPVVIVAPASPGPTPTPPASHPGLVRSIVNSVTGLLQ